MTIDLSRPPALVAVVAAAIVAEACFGYTTYVELNPNGGATREVSPAELQQLSAELDRRLNPLGLVRHPDLLYLQEIHEQSSDIGFRVIDNWIKDPVEVFVQQDKRDLTVCVVIRNHVWSRPTRFTDAIEEAVSEGTSAALPLRGVEIRHAVEGPSFVP